MKSVSLCVLISLFVAGAYGNIIFLRSGTIITPIVQNTTLQSIHGIRACDGREQFLDWRVSGCSPDTICTIVLGKTVQVEIDFTSHKNAAQLGLRIDRIEDGKVVYNFEKPIADSSVVGGNSYTLHCQAGPTKELAPGTHTFQVTLYNLEDNSTETCAEAEFFYI